MTRLPRALTAAIALLALSYLAAMAVTGAMPRQRQLVKFEARGVMQVPPEQITRIALASGSRRMVLHRTAGAAQWMRQDGSVVAPEAAAHLSMAVQMMNTSAPVKTLTQDELREIDRTPFGLDAPQVSGTLYRDDAPTLSMRFGRLNPEGYLQYMSVENDPQVFLMSRFVGEEWRQAAESLFK